MADAVEGPKQMEFAKSDALAGVPDEIREVPIGPMMGVAAIALNMAMKYHDINTVQDGALYQQYKLEGRNMNTLHLDMVFHTAVQIEAHLVSANKRVAKMMVLAALEDESEGEKSEEQETETPSASTDATDS